VTPAELITAIITEAGVLEPPYERSIAAAFESVLD
jgi:methylthioribose-1-phosphate isomerase